MGDHTNANGLNEHPKHSLVYAALSSIFIYFPTKVAVRHGNVNEKKTVVSADIV